MKLLTCYLFFKITINHDFRFTSNIVNLFTDNLFFKITAKNDLIFMCNMIISITRYLFFEITTKYDFKFTSNVVNLFTGNPFQSLCDRRMIQGMFFRYKTYSAAVKILDVLGEYQNIDLSLTDIADEAGIDLTSLMKMAIYAGRTLHGHDDKASGDTISINEDDVVMKRFVKFLDDLNIQITSRKQLNRKCQTLREKWFRPEMFKSSLN